MRRPMPSLWWEERTASRFRWACSSPKYIMAKATTRSRSQASRVNVSLFAIERATRSGPQDQPRPVSIRSRDIAAILAASAGRPGLRVMFFAFIGWRSDSGSTPRLADWGKKRLERLHDDQDYSGDEQDHRNLVEPSVPDMGLRVPIDGKIAQKLAAVQVVRDGERDHHELGDQPRAREAVAHQPAAEDDRQYRPGRHDASVELALHDLEAFPARGIVGHGVVDEQPRQVEQPGEPGDRENDVQRLDPEHVTSAGAGGRARSQHRTRPRRRQAARGRVPRHGAEPARASEAGRPPSRA